MISFDVIAPKGPIDSVLLALLQLAPQRLARERGT